MKDFASFLERLAENEPGGLSLTFAYKISVGKPRYSVEIRQNGELLYLSHADKARDLMVIVRKWLKA